MQDHLYDIWFTHINRQGNTFDEDGFYSKPSLEKLDEYDSKNKAAKPF